MNTLENLKWTNIHQWCIFAKYFRDNQELTRVFLSLPHFSVCLLHREDAVQSQTQVVINKKRKRCKKNCHKFGEIQVMAVLAWRTVYWAERCNSQQFNASLKGISRFFMTNCTFFDFICVTHGTIKTWLKHDLSLAFRVGPIENAIIRRWWS